jgi:hypothetical protein
MCKSRPASVPEEDSHLVKNMTTYTLGHRRGTAVKYSKINLVTCGHKCSASFCRDAMTADGVKCYRHSNENAAVLFF